MTLHGVLAACVFLAAGAFAAPARAQYFDDAIMPPRAVAWRLADRGFTEIGRPRFDGRAYVVEAFSPGGARVRLVIDPEDGAILARQRLDVPEVAIVRPVRPAPGYGWTEEDEGRRPYRQAERMLPPADIPGSAPRRTERVPYPARPLQGEPPRTAEPPRREARIPTTPRLSATDPGGAGAATSAGAKPEVNPMGLNPDAATGRAPATSTPGSQRKVARTAPQGDSRSSDPRSGERRPARVTPEAPKPDAGSAAAATPAAPQGEPDPKAAPARQAKSLESSPVEAKSGQTWTDPPEGKRSVRVIGGATIVPGGSAEKDPAPTQ